MYVYLRNGVTRQDLDSLSGLWRDGPVPDRVGFCTDGVGPRELLSGRSLNSILAAAVRSGLPIPTAVRMATLVPATRFGLAPWLGTLELGALADLAVFPDESFSAPSLVLSAGARPAPAPPGNLDGLRWRPPAERPDRSSFTPLPRGRYRAIAIEPGASLVTREFETDGGDALTAVAFDRLHARSAFRGLVNGLGLRGGAIASTTGSESVALLVIGDSAADMALAADRVFAAGGGVSVCSGGRELARWAAPLAGLLSDSDAETVAAGVEAVNAALRALGCGMADPLTTIDFLTSPAIPHLRISAGGYHRLRDGVRLPLEVGP